MTVHDDLSEWLPLLEGACAGDLAFDERRAPALGGDLDERVICRPVSLRGRRLPESVGACYVRARGSGGLYWYVLNRCRFGLSGAPEETLVDSEDDAKALVLALLQECAAQGWPAPVPGEGRPLRYPVALF